MDLFQQKEDGMGAVCACCVVAVMCGHGSCREPLPDGPYGCAMDACVDGVYGYCMGSNMDAKKMRVWVAVYGCCMGVAWVRMDACMDA